MTLVKTVTFSRFWHHQCIDMAETRKQIAFDLDTKALETYYPSESWNNAYEVIKRHMLKNGFSWLQGSVYVSKKQVTSAEVTNILDELEMSQQEKVKQVKYMNSDLKADRSA